MEEKAYGSPGPIDYFLGDLHVPNILIVHVDTGNEVSMQMINMQALPHVLKTYKSSKPPPLMEVLW